MIIGIGCDIVEHSLTKKLNWLTDLDVHQRTLSSQELKLFSSNKSIRFLAGRFAAKEALLKSLGTGMKDGFSLPNINILQNTEGKPVISLTGKIKKYSESLKIKSFHLSISHTPKYSYALVIAEGEIFPC